MTNSSSNRKISKAIKTNIGTNKSSQQVATPQTTTTRRGAAASANPLAVHRNSRRELLPEDDEEYDGEEDLDDDHEMGDEGEEETSGGGDGSRLLVARGIVDLSVQRTEGTKKACNTALNTFNKFLREFGSQTRVYSDLTKDEVTTTLLGQFATYLIVHCKKLSTAINYLSRVKTYFRRKYPNKKIWKTENSEWYDNITRKLNTAYNERSHETGEPVMDSAPDILLSDIETFVSLLLDNNQSIDMMNRCYLLWQYQFVGRVEEIANLLMHNLAFNRGNNFRMLDVSILPVVWVEYYCRTNYRFCASKVSMLRSKRGHQCKYRVTMNAKNWKRCPIHALASWLVLKGARQDSSRLFDFVKPKQGAAHMNQLLATLTQQAQEARARLIVNSMMKEAAAVFSPPQSKYQQTTIIYAVITSSSSASDCYRYLHLVGEVNEDVDGQHLLDLPAEVTHGLTSHSIRHGAANFLQESVHVNISQIADRGYWEFTTNKINLYTKGSLEGDLVVARALSEWPRPDVGGGLLTMWSAVFKPGTIDFQLFNAYVTGLFGTFQCLKDSNLPPILVSILVLHYKDVLLQYPQSIIVRTMRAALRFLPLPHNMESTLLKWSTMLSHRFHQDNDQYLELQATSSASSFVANVSEIVDGLTRRILPEISNSIHQQFEHAQRQLIQKVALVDSHVMEMNQALAQIINLSNCANNGGSFLQPSSSSLLHSSSAQTTEEGNRGVNSIFAAGEDGRRRRGGGLTTAPPTTNNLFGLMSSSHLAVNVSDNYLSAYGNSLKSLELQDVWYQWYDNQLFRCNPVPNTPRKDFWNRLCKIIAYMKHFTPQNARISRPPSDASARDQWRTSLRALGLCLANAFVDFINQQSTKQISSSAATSILKEVVKIPYELFPVVTNTIQDDNLSAHMRFRQVSDFHRG